MTNISADQGDDEFNARLEQWQQELTEFQGKLDSRDQAAVARETQLTKWQHELTEFQGKLDSRDQAAVARETQLTKWQHELNEFQTGLNSRLEAVGATEAQLQKWQQDLNELQGTLDSRDQAAAARETQLEVRQQEIDELDANLQAKKQAAEAEDSRLAQESAKLRDDWQELDKKKKEWEQFGRDLNTAATELEHRRHAADARDLAVTARESEVDQREADLSANAARLESEGAQLSELAAELEEGKAAHAELESKLNAEQARQDAQREQLRERETQLVEERAELDAEKTRHEDYLVWAKSREAAVLYAAIQDESSSTEQMEARPALPLDNQFREKVHDALIRAQYDWDEGVVDRALLFLLTALTTGDLLLLSGPPGSGKTSLGVALAEAVGANTTVIPARPSWLDSSDLLGYIDPVERVYRPTPFVDSLLAASTNEKSLQVVLIDEINIARIENYGADVITQLERAHEGGGKGLLRLYSKQDFDDAVRARRDLVDSYQVDPDTDRRYRSLMRYRHELAIPRNFALCGTLNNDETTHRLSPKVLDRSLNLRVANTARRDVRDAEPGAIEVDWVLDHSQVQAVALEGGDSEEDKSTLDRWQWASDQRGVLDRLGLTLSIRFKRSLKAGLRIGRNLGIDDRVVLDAFFLGKVLSGLKVLMIGETDITSSVEELQSECEQEGLAESIKALSKIRDDIETLAMASVL